MRPFYYTFIYNLTNDFDIIDVFCCFDDFNSNLLALGRRSTGEFVCLFLTHAISRMREEDKTLFVERRTRASALGLSVDRKLNLGIVLIFFFIYFVFGSIVFNTISLLR